MTIQKVIRAKPQTEEVPAGLVGYIVVRRSQPDVRGNTQWYVTHSPFSEVPVYMDISSALQCAEDSEYVLAIDLPGDA
jgi:hypothetical protein